MEPRRTQHACARCRRQKLKCDKKRPCPLCVHANVECKDATERTRRSNRIPRTLSPTSSAFPASPASTRGQLCNPVETPLVPHDGPTAIVTRAAPGVDDSAHARGPLPLPLQSSARRSSVAGEQQDQVEQAQERTSAFHLVDRIFKKYRFNRSTRSRAVDAIPDASPSAAAASAQDVDDRLSVRELIGIDLPPRNVVQVLLDSYFDAIHWYLMVIHEPSFRNQLDAVMTTGLVHRRQRPFLMVTLIVLVFGAWHIGADPQQTLCASVNMPLLEAQLLEVAERWYLPSWEETSIENVSFSYLLTSYYLYCGRTRAAFLTMQTTVGAAQSLGLHLESTWGPIDPIEREVRRRTWWGVVVGAGYVAMSYGRPCILAENDFEVRQPIDVDDCTATCPGFHSLEQRDDGKFWPVTIQSFQRYRAKLYIIVASITRNVYFERNRHIDDITKRVGELHRRLLDWERTIPPELKLESYVGLNLDAPENSLVRIFAVQAMSLQISYDNIQLFLFRPFLSHGKLSDINDSVSDGVLRSPASGQAGNQSADIVTTAWNQCWVSAMRTSLMGQHLNIARLTRRSPPGVHTGISAFTAAVVLCLLALSNPLSARGQECKRGIARLIQVASKAELNAPIWMQMTQVLKDLMHVIATEETRALVSGDEDLDPQCGIGLLPSFGAPPSLYPGPPAQSRPEQGRQGPEQGQADTSNGLTSVGLEAQQTGTANLFEPPGSADAVEECSPQSSDIRMAAVLHSMSQPVSGPTSRMSFPDFGIYPEWLGENLLSQSQTWIWDDAFSSI